MRPDTGTFNELSTKIFEGGGADSQFCKSPRSAVRDPLRFFHCKWNSKSHRQNITKSKCFRVKYSKSKYSKETSKSKIFEVQISKTKNSNWKYPNVALFKVKIVAQNFQSQNYSKSGIILVKKSKASKIFEFQNIKSKYLKTKVFNVK